MIGRLALRSLTAHPVRSAVLAAGFGVGVAVMAILLGVAEIVLDQAQSPALVGGGDVLIRLTPAGAGAAGARRARCSPTRCADASASRRRRTPTRSVSAARRHGRRAWPRAAASRASSARSAIRRRRTIDAWRDTPADVGVDAATRPRRCCARSIAFTRFRTRRRGRDSWAEWLYFNGRVERRALLPDVPRRAAARRTARAPRACGCSSIATGRWRSFSARRAAHRRGVAARAGPDDRRELGAARRAALSHPSRSRGRATAARRRAICRSQASPGRLVPPLEITGARGWRTGYVVPVMSGALDGDARRRRRARVARRRHRLSRSQLGVLAGRVVAVGPGAAGRPVVHLRPRVSAARGRRSRAHARLRRRARTRRPLGYATNVRITEENDDRGQPRTIAVRARGTALDLELQFDVASAVTTRMAQGPLANGVNFLQMRGQYTVSGRAGCRDDPVHRARRRRNLPAANERSLGHDCSSAWRAAICARRRRSDSCFERVVERQPDLRGIPSARQLRGHGLTPADLHPEAIEAQRARPVGLGMRLVAEAVARLARAAARAQIGAGLRTCRCRAPHAAMLARVRAAVERQLLTVVDLPKCLRHVSRPLAVALAGRATLASGGYDRLGHCGEGQRAKAKAKVQGRGPRCKGRGQAKPQRPSTSCINCRSPSSRPRATPLAARLEVRARPETPTKCDRSSSRRSPRGR